MIELYTWTTPNGDKLHIMLEETRLPYRVHPVDIGAGDQFKPEFLKISPNNKIPAIIDIDGPDGEPLSMFDSCAILIYLGEKSGQFLPRKARERLTVLQWLLFQAGHIGPMLGQAHHFFVYAPEKIRYAIERYGNEANRLYGVMNRRLSEHAYLAGDDYTIADIATFPWLSTPENQGVDMRNYPHVRRWFDAIASRPAVIRGLQVMADKRGARSLDVQAWENLFGARQYQRR
ncbi:MAG TPA: glutathione binding-like protein [Gammaproteobacteria bacterium]|nr:glutathione binding-like protein [Gammaproteobacteria bacterium]